MCEYLFFDYVIKLLFERCRNGDSVFSIWCISLPLVVTEVHVLLCHLLKHIWFVCMYLMMYWVIQYLTPTHTFAIKVSWLFYFIFIAYLLLIELTGRFTLHSFTSASVLVHFKLLWWSVTVSMHFHPYSIVLQFVNLWVTVMKLHTEICTKLLQSELGPLITGYAIQI